MIPVGIVGAGRTRNGLGPFLARYCERAGLHVAGVAGRNRERAEVAAGELRQLLAHPVIAHDDVVDLASSGIRALIVASPPEHHLAALDAALGAGLHVYCDKPLVHVDDTDAALSVLDGFERRNLVVVEGCQWPMVLHQWPQLFPDREDKWPVGSIELGLSPSRVGPDMVADSLSHLLSLVQVYLQPPQDLVLQDAVWRQQGEGAGRLDLRFGHGGDQVAAVLHLQACATQPRPAWLAWNGLRMDRVVDRDYGISFTAGGKTTSVGDPLWDLVYGFAVRLEMPNVERIPSVAVIAQRARLYREILRRIG